MKTWIKRTLYGLFGATLVVGGLSGCGHRQDSHGWRMNAEESEKMRGKMVERVSSKLDLNADQRQRLTVLGEKLHAQRTALVGQTFSPRAEMQALVAGEKFDKARAQALVAEKTAALQSGSPAVVSAMADFYDSLNAAQQQKVRDFMQRGHGCWHRG